MRALPNGRAAPYDQRASCRFYVEGARPPEAFHADITGTKSWARRSGPSHDLVTYNSYMQEYLDFMRHVRDYGHRKDDRTGTGTTKKEAEHSAAAQAYATLVARRGG